MYRLLKKIQLPTRETSLQYTLSYEVPNWLFEVLRIWYGTNMWNVKQIKPKFRDVFLRIRADDDFRFAVEVAYEAGLLKTFLAQQGACSRASSSQ
jgi:hypothetical protein